MRLQVNGDLDSPALQSIRAGREAPALSLMNEGKAANRSLTAAMRLVDRREMGRPSPDWAKFHGPAELDYSQGRLFTELGHHRAAVPYLQAALAHQDRTYGRNRALSRLTLAKGLVQAGEVDAGAAHAVESLDPRQVVRESAARTL